MLDILTRHYNKNDVTGNVSMTFENGYSISIVIGNGIYCDKKSLIMTSTKYSDNVKSNTAEIAIFFEGEYVTNDILKIYDDVKGFVTMNELIDICTKIKNL